VSLRCGEGGIAGQETDDQQGLRTLDTWRSRRRAHKPGDLISTFETRAPPNPRQHLSSFEETVYMLDLPSDKPDLVTKGFTAFADFAGGLTLDPKEIDKERGVVIEEWRGGLGAQSRVRDKEIPVLFYHSRFADRLPIGKVDILRSFPPARLRAFYDTYYRPEKMAVIAVGDMDPQTLESGIKAAFSALKDRAPAPPAQLDIAEPEGAQRLDPDHESQSSVSITQASQRSDRHGRRLSARSRAAALRADAERTVRGDWPASRRQVPRRRRRR
jgi:hypothetical protein